MRKFRVGIVGLLQESNTFIDCETTLDHFKEDLYLFGDAICEEMKDSPHEVGGFFYGLEEAGVEAVPLFLARALPYGVIKASAFDQIVEDLLGSLDGAGKLDGILAAPHGATVAANHPDADGYWLSLLRQRMGADFPLIATIDPHANLSPLMVDSTTAIVAYSTNPHLDQRETGTIAARMMADTLCGKISPVQDAAFPPMAINIQSQNTSCDPMLLLYEQSEEIADDPSVLSHSIVLGFPYADVHEMGSSVLVVANWSKTLASQKATEVAGLMCSMRESFEPKFLDVAEAVQKVVEVNTGPVVLLDMGDNVGGGSPGDETEIANQWMEKGEGAGFVCLHDFSAVASAKRAGMNEWFSAGLGNRDFPIQSKWRVVSLHDGKFQEAEARHGGFSHFDQGETAVLESESRNLVVMATTRRMAPFSLSQLTTFGIRPEQFKMIIAKGVIAPMAAYAPIAKGGFLHVDSSGVTRADMTKLEFQNRRRPMFPFEKDTEWK